MSEITPEKVAAVLSKGHAGWRWGLDASLSVTAQSNVLRLETTRWLDDEEGTEVVTHFRAVVVEGETDPIVVVPEFLAAARALYRWHVAASALDADMFAALVYEVDDALAALTPEQVAVLAGDAAEAAQAEKGGTDA